MSARSARSFFDTNILLYTDSRDAAAKRKRAFDLLGEHRLARSGVVSLSPPGIFRGRDARKLGVDVDVARRKVELFANFHLVVLDVEDVLAAVDLHRLHQVSFWDALIVRAAKQGGCPDVYSEDLQHDRTIDGVRIVNPFR